MEEKLQEIAVTLKEKGRKTSRRLRKRICFYLVKLSRWKYGRIVFMASVAALVVVVCSTFGYFIGKSSAHKKDKIVEKKLLAQIEKSEEENRELEEKLHKFELQTPEERPWYLQLVNDLNPIEDGYVPKLAAFDAETSVDERILKPLKTMIRDAEKAGLKPYVCSGYRTAEYQKELYNRYMGNAVRAGKTYWEALEETRKCTAYPGRSEHGMGLAVDIISLSYTGLDEKQQETPEAKWLAANCHKYGFILRYPVGKTDITGIIYEPWHYRYVGGEDATKIMESGLTLEEYLGEVD